MLSSTAINYMIMYNTENATKHIRRSHNRQRNTSTGHSTQSVQHTAAAGAPRGSRSRSRAKGRWRTSTGTEDCHHDAERCASTNKTYQNKNARAPIHKVKLMHLPGSKQRDHPGPQLSGEPPAGYVVNTTDYDEVHQRCRVGTREARE